MLSRVSERCATLTGLEQVLRRYVWSAAWLRDAEPVAAASQNIDLSCLMERAGRAAYDVFAELYTSQRHWLILVGPGNNGGDGYVIARHAREAGKNVTVLCMPHSKLLPTEAANAQHAWQAVGGTETTVNPGAPLQLPADVDLIVDGLLGTGICGPPREPYEDVIRHINSLPVPRVAIDIPSGLNAETGEAAGACVKADHTVTFICLKPGLLTGRARDYVGQLHYRSLGLGDWMTTPERLRAALCRRVALDDVHEYFGTRRSPSAHKGSCGKVTLVGGDRGFGGAILMSAEACVTVGAGLTRVLTRPEYVAPLLTRCPEVMVTGVETDTGEQLEQQMREAFEWASTLAVGPGLGTSAYGQAVLTAALRQAEVHSGKTLVLDADALNLLADLLHGSEGVAAAGAGNRLPVLPNSIITPHAGEAARLLACPVADVEKDRLAAARRLASILGGTCLLKGPGTVVHCHSSSRTAIVDAGNAGMASGGMGDVLTGLLAGLAAQRMHDTFDTTCAGALMHGVAADMVAAEEGRGTRGIRATELIGRVPFIVNAFGSSLADQQRRRR